MKRRIPPPIQTERLLLRLLDPGDAPALLALYGDGDVMRHWNHRPWTTLAQAQAAVAEARRDVRNGSALHLAIVLRASGELIGSCALYDVKPATRRALVGYLLARRHWGHGYAGEALRALLAQAFLELELDWIEAEVDRDNDASIRLLERLGFLHRSERRAQWMVMDQPQEVALYALARSNCP